jgi:hypothetical protein
LRKEHRLRILENGVLRKINGLIREDVTGKWGDFIMRRFRICTKYYWDEKNHSETDGWAMWHVWGRRKVLTGFRWGNPRERDQLDDRLRQGYDIKRDLREIGGGKKWINLTQDRDRW